MKLRSLLSKLWPIAACAALGSLQGCRPTYLTKEEEFANYVAAIGDFRSEMKAPSEPEKGAHMDLDQITDLRKRVVATCSKEYLESQLKDTEHFDRVMGALDALQDKVTPVEECRLITPIVKDAPPELAAAAMSMVARKALATGAAAEAMNAAFRNLEIAMANPVRRACYAEAVLELRGFPSSKTQAFRPALIQFLRKEVKGPQPENTTLVQLSMISMFAQESGILRSEDVSGLRKLAAASPSRAWALPICRERGRMSLQRPAKPLRND